MQGSCTAVEAHTTALLILCERRCSKRKLLRVGEICGHFFTLLSSACEPLGCLRPFRVFDSTTYRKRLASTRRTHGCHPHLDIQEHEISTGPVYSSFDIEPFKMRADEWLFF